ncbi:MAG TPA: hypothetical protein VGS02_08170 [Acidobacteriaceae bacterium]|nr:hypothetical protein [Acidobacteriaceae bacterium]
MNSVRRFPAVLRGMGVDSKCTLEVWQERSSSGRDFTRCHIVDDPPFLPDGAYQLLFAGQTVNTRKTFGAWELIFLSSDMDLSSGNRASDLAG